MVGSAAGQPCCLDPGSKSIGAAEQAMSGQERPRYDRRAHGRSPAMTWCMEAPRQPIALLQMVKYHLLVPFGSLLSSQCHSEMKLDLILGFRAARSEEVFAFGHRINRRIFVSIVNLHERRLLLRRMHILVYKVEHRSLNPGIHEDAKG
jgi:hypothetical protein